MTGSDKDQLMRLVPITVWFFVLFITLFIVRIVVISLPSVQKMGFFIRPGELHPAGLRWWQAFNALFLLLLIPLFTNFGRRLQNALGTLSETLSELGELAYLGGVVGAVIAGYFALYDLFVPPLLARGGVWGYHAIFALVIGGHVIHLGHGMILMILRKWREDLAPLLTVGMVALFVVVMRSVILSLQGVQASGFAVFPWSTTYPRGLLWSQVIDAAFRAILLIVIIIFGEHVRTTLIARAEKLPELGELGYLAMFLCAIIFGYTSFDDIILPPLASQQAGWAYSTIFGLVVAGVGVLVVYQLARMRLRKKKEVTISLTPERAGLSEAKEAPSTQCNGCGASVDRSDSYCRQCGAKLQKDES